MDDDFNTDDDYIQTPLWTDADWQGVRDRIS